jgi:5-bromo-4-chloroindolyl phosphate hydrolysis protein
MKKLHQVYAYYLTALCAAVCALAFPVYRAWGLLAAIVICIAVFRLVKAFLCEKTVKFEVKFAKTGVAEADAMLKRGREFLEELNALNTQISDETMNGQVNALILTGRDIFGYVGKNPEQARQIIDFTDYYLPTATRLVKTYIELKDKGNVAGNISETVGKIKGVMETVVAAFYKELDSLYTTKSLDIKSDIAVLETVLKREGLK